MTQAGGTPYGVPPACWSCGRLFAVQPGFQVLVQLVDDAEERDERPAFGAFLVLFADEGQQKANGHLIYIYARVIRRKNKRIYLISHYVPYKRRESTTSKFMKRRKGVECLFLPFYLVDVAWFRVDEAVIVQLMLPVKWDGSYCLVSAFYFCADFLS